MERLDRNAPLPFEMQGTWKGAGDDWSEELAIDGGNIVCFEQEVKYDYKLVDRSDGAIAVILKIDDEAMEDDFQRSNITGLVITPEGEFHVYNTRFACQFERT